MDCAPSCTWPRRGTPARRRISPRTCRSPRDYLIQLAQLLQHAGIIEARPGKHGGYRLANDPSKITLLQVVNALDDDAKDTTRTRRKDRADASMVQGIKQAYDLVLTGYDAYFDSITLQMLLDASQDESMGKEFLAGRLIAESQRLLAEAAAAA